MICRLYGAESEVPQSEWFPAMERRITESTLPPGLHWIRLYHIECPTAETVNEVLLDNETCTDWQDHLASYPWPPPADRFYSVRVFLMILDQSRADAR